MYAVGHGCVLRWWACRDSFDANRRLQLSIPQRISNISFVACGAARWDDFPLEGALFRRFSTLIRLFDAFILKFLADIVEEGCCNDEDSLQKVVRIFCRKIQGDDDLELWLKRLPGCIYTVHTFSCLAQSEDRKGFTFFILQLQKKLFFLNGQHVI